MLTPNHYVILLIFHHCNFATLTNHNVHIWYAGDVEGSFSTQRGLSPQVKNAVLVSADLSQCRTAAVYPTAYSLASFTSVMPKTKSSFQELHEHMRWLSQLQSPQWQRTPRVFVTNLSGACPVMPVQNAGLEVGSTSWVHLGYLVQNPQAPTS